mgnify:CR=1 FL=1|jgi:hypothetical protein
MAYCSYEVKTINYNELKKIVKLPKFQRSVVWSVDQRHQLIDTIRRGYPFGSLLLYEIFEENYKYQLIDGLQRLTTIMHFENNKYEYINLADVATEEFEVIFSKYEEIARTPASEPIKQKIFNIVSSLFKNNTTGHSLTRAIIESLRENMPIFSNIKLQDTVIDQIESMDKKIKKEVDLSSLTLPVVIFRGDKSELPTIYDKVNSTGTKLSKYEIFSAIWNNEIFKMEDHEILSWVDKKYETMIEVSGITINDYTPGSIIESGEINLFEYAYALGKIIIDKCNEMFCGKNTDASQIDSIGFALMTVCVDLSLKQMDKLPDYYYGVSPKNLSKLKDKLVECSVFVNDILKKYIITRDGKNFTKYLEAQIVSIIGTIFKIKYSVTTGLRIVENPNSAFKVKLFKRHMPKHYLYDIIKDHWAGSGDRKVDDILKGDITNNKYINPIPEENWRATLDEWLSIQETKISKNIMVQQKLFLNYMNKLTDIADVIYSKYSFDIEHIVPINRLMNRLKEGPFSALGNLCFLPSFENRSKKDKTLYEQIEENTIIYNLDIEALNKFYYAEKSELDFIKSYETFTKERYTKFLKDRHNFLINKFIELINKL